MECSIVNHPLLGNLLLWKPPHSLQQASLTSKWCTGKLLLQVERPTERDLRIRDDCSDGSRLVIGGYVQGTMVVVMMIRWIHQMSNNSRRLEGRSSVACTGHPAGCSKEDKAASRLALSTEQGLLHALCIRDSVLLSKRHRKRLVWTSVKEHCWNFLNRCRTCSSACPFEVCGADQQRARAGDWYAQDCYIATFYSRSMKV